MYRNLALIPWQRLQVQEPYAGTPPEQACHDSLSSYNIGFVLCMHDEVDREWPAMLKTAAQQQRKNVLLVLRPCEFLKDPFVGIQPEKITLYHRDAHMYAAVIPVEFIKAAFMNIQDVGSFLHVVKGHNLAVDGDPSVIDLPK